jgi:hypothetical protein
MAHLRSCEELFQVPHASCCSTASSGLLGLVSPPHRRGRHWCRALCTRCRRSRSGICASCARESTLTNSTAAGALQLRRSLVPGAHPRLSLPRPQAEAVLDQREFGCPLTTQSDQGPVQPPCQRRGLCAAKLSVLAPAVRQSPRVALCACEHPCTSNQVPSHCPF